MDLQPNDIVAPPPGNPIVNADTGIIRYARTYALAGLPALSFVQVSGGSTSPSGALSSMPSSSGIGDTSFATVIWPYANRETRTYLGLAAYLNVPTGAYSNQQSINLGANRFSEVLQVAFQTPLLNNLDLAVAFDTQWFGTNGQYGPNNAQLTQKPLYTTQVEPIFKINQTFTVAASYLYVQGAQSSVNGMQNNDTTQTQRYLLSAVAYIPHGRLTLQYGRDLKTADGLQESQRINLRYSFSF